MDAVFACPEIGRRLGIKCVENAPLAARCFYGTGGRCDALFFPRTEEDVVGLAAALDEEGIDRVYLGNGSNVLVSDEGYRGAVICTAELKGITVSGKIVKAMAGDSLKDVIYAALYNSLGGIEFLCGIPATVGGAVAMNAGCYGKSIGDYVVYVRSTAGLKSNADCAFGYRTSAFRGGEGVISVAFDLDNVEFDQSENKVNYYAGMRRNRQPGGRSCGSVFKNDGYYAGKVIESCSLKGARIGGARVSEKHANFIIAESGATSRDISRLIAFVKKKVKEQTDVELKEEIVYIGRFEDEDNL